jgi:hypothetical protein
MKSLALILGDVIALALVTVIGFASHGEFTAQFLPRMAASFVPLCIGWFLLAPQLGLFQHSVARTVSQLWRPAFVMLFAGPLATLLRGIVLGAPVIPSFAIVLTLTAAVGLTLWRLLWLLLAPRAVT